MKLQEIQRKDGKHFYSIVLPVELVRAKGWTKGMELKVKIDGKGNLVLTE